MLLGNKKHFHLSICISCDSVSEVMRNIKGGATCNIEVLLLKMTVAADHKDVAGFWERARFLCGKRPFGCSLGHMMYLLLALVGISYSCSWECNKQTFYYTITILLWEISASSSDILHCDYSTSAFILSSPEWKPSTYLHIKVMHALLLGACCLFHPCHATLYKVLQFPGLLPSGTFALAIGLSEDFSMFNTLASISVGRIYIWFCGYITLPCLWAVPMELMQLWQMAMNTNVPWACDQISLECMALLLYPFAQGCQKRSFIECSVQSENYTDEPLMDFVEHWLANRKLVVGNLVKVKLLCILIIIDGH